MPRRLTTDVLAALAGVALGVLVFLPWWEYDPARLADFASGWTAYAPLRVDLSAWGTTPGRALLWIATGALAAVLLVASQAASAAAMRRLRGILVVAAAISLALALAGLVDAPRDDYRAAAVAYIGTALIAVIGTCAAFDLRRA